MSDIKIIKKKPGRPKKDVIRKVVPKEGIVSMPCNASLEAYQPMSVNVVEIIYDNPMMFKKIFNLFKTMEVDTVRLLFDKDTIKMYCTVHSNKSRIYIKIYGACMNRYYRHEQLEISFSPGNINKILSTLTKDHGQIIIASNRQNKQSKICVVLCNDEMDVNEVYDIEINNADPYDWSIEQELEKEVDYPIKFDLTARYFKKKISDCDPLCDILRIEKTGYEDLHFSYVFKDKHGCLNSYFKNPGKINLISYLDDGEIFSTGFHLEHVKPFSSALIADEITISADKDNALIFTAYLDREERTFVPEADPTVKVKSPSKKYKVAGTEKCVIKVITEIVKADT
jgi:hypothetical protein